MEKYATGGKLTSWRDRTSCWMDSIPTWDDNLLKKDVAAKAEEAWRNDHIALWGNYR